MMKNRISILLLAVMIFLPPAPVQASDGVELPPLDDFIGEVTSGDPAELRGLYASGVMAYEVLPQPEGSPAYVSHEQDALTLFEMALDYDTTGLLAHNYLAGADFFRLERGQVIHLIYGDGRTETFVIRRFLRYRALSPNSVTGNFVDLESGELLTAAQLFMKVYNRPGSLVLQTCIEAEGNRSWGRLFVIAEPFDENAPRSMPRFASLQ